MQVPFRHPSVTQDLPAGSSIPGAQVAGASTPKVQLWYPHAFLDPSPLSTVPICRPAYPSCCRLTLSGGQGRRKYEKSEKAGPVLGQRRKVRGMGSGWHDLCHRWRSRCQTAGVFLTMVPDAGCTAWQAWAWQRRRRVCLLCTFSFRKEGDRHIGGHISTEMGRWVGG